jgi:hypothetical protein
MAVWRINNQLPGGCRTYLDTSYKRMWRLFNLVILTSTVSFENLYNLRCWRRTWHPVLEGVCVWVLFDGPSCFELQPNLHECQIFSGACYFVPLSYFVHSWNRMKMDGDQKLWSKNLEDNKGSCWRSILVEVILVFIGWSDSFQTIQRHTGSSDRSVEKWSMKQRDCRNHSRIWIILQ